MPHRCQNRQQSTNLSRGVLAQYFVITLIWQLNLTQYAITLARRRHQQCLTALHKETNRTSSQAYRTTGGPTYLCMDYTEQLYHL